MLCGGGARHSIGMLNVVQGGLKKVETSFAPERGRQSTNGRAKTRPRPHQPMG